MAVNPSDPHEPEDAVPLTEPEGATRLHLLPGSASGALETAVEDTVDAMFAVVAVAAALARYAVEVGLEAPRAAVRRLPLVAERGATRAGGLLGLAARLTARPRSAAVRIVSAVADDVVPWVAAAALSRLDVPALVRDYVDVDRVAALLDVDAVAARIDLDAIVDRVDVAAVVAKVDLDAIVEKVDIARVIDRVDLDGVVAGVDLDAVVARVDLDRAVDRVDIARVIDKVDLDAIVDRVDLDRAVGRVDIDRAIARADIVGLAQWVVREIDLPAVIRSSTESVTAEVVHGVRAQGADADRAVERVVDRLLRRQPRHSAVPAPRPAADSETRS